MSERWYAFFDDAYDYMRKSDPGTCPAGTQCSPSGWACCAFDVPGPRASVGLPYEARYQEFALKNDKQLADGCPICMPKKTLLCALWPILPCPTPNGYGSVQFVLACEALLQAQDHYLKVLDFAIHLTELLRGKHVGIRDAFFLAVHEQVTVYSEPSLILGYAAAKRILSGSPGPLLMKGIMELAPADKPMNDEYRRLPIL